MFEGGQTQWATPSRPIATNGGPARRRDERAEKPFRIGSLVVDPATPATIYAGVENAGIYKSTDSGAHWISATQPANVKIKALAIQDPSHLFAAMYDGGVYRSENSGSDWTLCGTAGLNLKLLSLMFDGNGKLYAGTEAGVFVSTDNCATWAAMLTGLPN